MTIGKMHPALFHGTKIRDHFNILIKLLFSFCMIEKLFIVISNLKIYWLINWDLQSLLILDWLVMFILVKNGSLVVELPSIWHQKFF